MASSLLCDNCGAQNATSEGFCGTCGYALTEAVVVAATALTMHSTPTGQLPTAILLKRRYRVIQTIGQGGMGAVHGAEDTLLGNRLVAVKEMSQGNMYGQQAQNAVESFQREAHLLAGLQHPNLPSIHDYFEEAGRWYLVMSFIQGETLADYLDHAQDQRLSLEETLRIGQTLCHVLNYLHTHQPPIIFRDLKPSNIMRSSEGHIYLIDFGIARHFKPGQVKDTSNYGSMGYAPPEQYGRAQTTERSDIYSLGATLYECLSGYDPSQSPFHLPPLQTLAPTLPERLVTLITQMLEMDESKRPASITVVEQELQQVNAPKAAPKRFALKPATPKQPTPTPSVAPMPYTPQPTPSALAQYTPPPAPTQYPPTQVASPPSMQNALPPAPTPYPSIQFAPPPMVVPAGQIYLQPVPIANFTPIPAQTSPIKKTLAVIVKTLSIIGMVIGGLFAFMGIIIILVPTSSGNVFGDIVAGGILLLFGLMVFFIARIRKTSLTVSKTKKVESVLGIFLGITALIFGITIAIFGGVTNTSANGNSGGIIGGVFALIFGVIIWWITRIRIKKTS
jgi:serine/threonine protein kinase